MTSPERAPRALILDHDGTVIDSLALVVAASNAVRAECGQAPAPAAEIIAGMVLPTGPRMGELCGVADATGQRALAEAFYTRARDLGPDHARPYPGVAAVLRALHRRGWLLAMVTNNEGRLARRLLAATGLAPLFARVVGEEDMTRPKPAPDGIHDLMRAFGLQRRRTLYVGDAATDARAAHAAGIRCLAVSWGTHRDTELARGGFDARCRTASELLHLAWRMV